MTRFTTIISVCACLVALAVPSMAFAQADTEGYGDDASTILPSIQDGGNDPSDDGRGKDPSVADGGNLPFTGADLGILAAAGGSLVLLGFGLRRMTVRSERA